jgi:hypothetical protein
VTSLPDVITLGAEEEARRLWAAAEQAMGRAGKDLVALFEALDLGLRAAEVLLVQRLQPVKEKFPATIVSQLELPDPEVDIVRDAVSTPRTIEFTELLDLLSDMSLDCIGPRLHRGWEDRRFSCRRSRETTQQALGVSLDATQRDDLLLLAAYRNRLFRYPPPVRIQPKAAQSAFASLRKLIQRIAAD